MEITISSGRVALSSALVEATRQKIGRLDRLDAGIARAEVRFFAEKNPRIAEKEGCEVWLDGGGQQLRCRVTAADGFVAVDRAVDKLAHQLHRVKTRKAKVRR